MLNLNKKKSTIIKEKPKGNFNLEAIVFIPVSFVLLIVVYATLTPLYSLIFPYLDNTEVFALGSAAKMVLLLIPFIMALVVLLGFFVDLRKSSGQGGYF